MQPLLYYSNHPIPSPARMKYLGRLTKCIKCSVSTQINSDYQLSAVFSPSDELINEIQNQRFIAAKANPFDPPQYFEIYDYSTDESGKVTVSARHIKHCAFTNIMKSDNARGAQSDTPQGHWDFCCQYGNLSSENFFTFSSAITATGAMEIGYTKADTIGMFLEEMARVFGGEFHFDNFNIGFSASLGTKKNYVLRWNKNIGSPKLDINTAQLYTHVAAFANFTAKYTLEGVNYEYPVQFCSDPKLINGGWDGVSLYRTLMVDVTNRFPETTISYTEFAEKQSAVNSYASWYARNGTLISVQTAPNVNLTVNYRPALDEMSAVGLGDTVDVMLKGGRTVEAKITKTVFDSLSERWTSIELGKEKLMLSKYIAKTR